MKLALSTGDQIPSVLGTLTVRQLVGRGGFGEVYEAAAPLRDGEAIAERYAIKVLRLTRQSTDKHRRRIMAEGRTLSEIRHPNVVRVHDFGVSKEGLIHLVMDLLVGRTLAELVEQMGRMPPIPWVLKIAADTCRGLSAIHRLAVHRDVKATNIHVGVAGERICLFDLGAGKFVDMGLRTTDQYSTTGTLIYMSPEQIMRPAEVDHRSDLFSLGVTLYELLTGKHPFAPREHDNAGSLSVRIANEPHPSLRAHAHQSLPDDAVLLIERMLMKDPAHRPNNALLLAEAFDDVRCRFEAKFGSAPMSVLSETLPLRPPSIAPESGDEPIASRNPYVETTPARGAALSLASTDKAEEPAASMTTPWDNERSIIEKLVAEANRGGPGLDAVVAVLDAPPPVIRVTAAALLERHGRVADLPALRRVLSQENVPMIRRQLEDAILAIERRAQSPMTRAEARPTPTPNAARVTPKPSPAQSKAREAERAALFVATMKSELARDPVGTSEALIAALTHDPAAQVRAAAARLIGEVAGASQQALAILRDRLSIDTDVDVREHILEAMDRISARSEVPAPQASAKPEGAGLLRRLFRKDR